MLSGPFTTIVLTLTECGVLYDLCILQLVSCVSLEAEGERWTNATTTQSNLLYSSRIEVYNATFPKLHVSQYPFSRSVSG
ncbi:uncharacterized protein EV420DRAFT_1583745 [Desarmillaria tabescens]|uniref:Secreted protein n=1 Tax=Armillaria tabescens TaxID=1929756 RepID=A0AA39JCV1_ARMTA|nr:uncharacterized protein EV420DRAFT_1583745 [Desarmillaria tabescens]KAK0439466.1 hypothetical protein EV420DRAFT_1583745 [Desarmillaria tabescens]